MTRSCYREISDSPAASPVLAAHIHLRPISAEKRPCKICGGEARLYGEVDFNRSCEETRGLKLPPLGIPVHYFRCPDCSFLFTDCFDDWTQAEFKQFIYNEGYIEVDPDYLTIRPAINAVKVLKRFDRDRSSIRILDYGGGNGLLAQRLRSAGFAHVTTYDPFTPEFCSRPDTQFDLITSFETFEHLPDPLSVFDVLVDLLTPSGVVLFSTLVQPPAFDSTGMTWWYIGPRNGHVSLFSERALAVAWQRHGFSVSSFDPDLHLAQRR
jgi:2-polyprenyl-6-hydroxyphenyl methylase/3-demethylubiquinone-9 3-methyltransferase